MSYDQNEEAPVIQIREAEREGARLVLGIAGWSGSGKTFTALQLALGLAKGDPKKIGFLDAENKRGSLYSDIFAPKKFYIADLFAPFSPERYAQSIRIFEKKGVEVLVMDSVTHEWEGIGGCHDIANAGKKIERWDLAKERHLMFMNTMLQCPMHIICCIRAREKAHPERIRDDEGKEKTIYVNDGLMPIQEKNFMFEMTASVMMFDEGKRQQVLKCPEVLRPILGRQQGYITVEDGMRLREWIDGAKITDPEVERWRHILQNTAPLGVEALRKKWESETPKAIKKTLGESFIATTRAAAEAFDKKRFEEKVPQSGNAVVDALNQAGQKPTEKQIY